MRAATTATLILLLPLLAGGVSPPGSVASFEGGGFLVPVFRHAGAGGNAETLGMMITRDNFATFTDLFPGDLYLEPAGKGVRDASIIRQNAFWYCIYTRDAFTQPQNKFGICRSSDLQTWTHYADITVADSFQLLWAPAWFLDRRTGTYGITVTWDPSPGFGAHVPHVGMPADDTFLSWTWTVIGGLPIWFYDCRIEADDTKYYAVGVASSAPNNLRIYSSTSLTSGYTLHSTPDIGGVSAEQCKLYWLGGTRWRLTYFDNPNRKFFMRTSTDGMASWSPPKLLKTLAGDPAERSFTDIIELIPEHYIVSTDASNISLTFTRPDESESTRTLNAEWGSDLTGWTAVPIGPTSAAPDSHGATVTVTENGVAPDTVVVSVPMTNAVSGRLFLRLNATPPSEPPAATSRTSPLPRLPLARPAPTTRAQQKLSGAARGSAR